MKSDSYLTSSLKKSKKKSFQAVIVWSTASLFYLYEMVLRNSTSVMAHGLMDSFDLHATALGVLASFYYHAYTPMQIPCGLLVDRFGPHLIITISSLLCTFGSVFFAQADIVVVAQIGRFLMGAGSACAYIGCLKLSVLWFKPAQFATLAGLTNMLGTFGGFLATTPLASVVENRGWRSTMMILAYIGIGVTILCYALIKNTPDKNIAAVKQQKKINTKQVLWILMRDPKIWAIGLVGGLMYLPLSAFCGLWGTPFLIKTFSLTNQQAAIGPLVVYLGAAIGAPILAIISIQWLKVSLITIMAFSALTTAISFFLVSYAQLFSFNIVLVFLGAAGFLIGGQVLCFSFVKDRIDDTFSATAMAFTNTLVMACGNLFQPLLGVILDWQWDKKIDGNGVPIYSTDAYHTAIMSIPMALTLAFIVLLFMREKKMKKK